MWCPVRQVGSGEGELCWLCLGMVRAPVSFAAGRGGSCERTGGGSSVNQDRKQRSDRLRGAALATERRAESTGIASSSEISCSSQGLCVVCGQTELHQRILQVGLSGSCLQPGGVTSKQDHSSEYLEIKTKQGQWWISMTNVEGHVVSLGR